MKVKDFFRRRLIRLHPMIILGFLLGAITFFIHGGEQWDGTPVSPALVMLALLLSLFLIPAAPGSSVEVRGNGEMFPLNGPIWSLFFEYIGNILYALFIRRLPTGALTLLVLLAGGGLASFALFNLSGFGHLGVGWTMADYNLYGGSLRLLFSFSAGLLMTRNFKPVRIRGAFWICVLLIVILLSVPYIGDGTAPWKNGLYDAVSILIVFPLLVYLGASGKITDKKSSKLCKLLGDISYPLYAVHYPFMYLFYVWLWGNGVLFSQAWPVALLLFAGNILLAYLLLKFYDEPVRRYLTGKLRRG